MKKNTAIIVTIVAWDTILNTGKTGDHGNITLRGVGDGSEYTPAASAVEVDATNLPGVYSVSLTEAENNYDSNLIGGKSATANISIFGIAWINEEVDFGATEKASITAAVPSVVQVQDGLAPAGEYDTEMSRIDVAVSTRTKPADTQARVTLVDTVTENTDMRGTDDAGTALNLATVDTVVDAIKTVTDALTLAAATKLALSAGSIVTGTVSHDKTVASTTVFYCDDIIEATANHFNGRIVIFTSGDLQYQATDITAYELSDGEGKFTVTAVTEGPGDNVTFIIV